MKVWIKTGTTNGQIVTESGDYLCIDCGFIESFEVGEIFPVCEVCLSGDPSAVDAKEAEGYWELV
jgi:hypothetical protein